MPITRTYENLRPAHSPPRTMRLARIGFNWQDPPPENLESVDPRDARMLLWCEAEVMVLAEVFLDHLHAHIARSPLLTVELDSPQPFQIRQMLAQLVRRKPFLLMPRIDLAQPPRNLTRAPRSLTYPDDLNIHLGGRQYPEDLLLRHPRLRQTKTRRTGHLSRTHFRPIPMTPQERIRQRAPRTDQQSPKKACILQ